MVQEGCLTSTRSSYNANELSRKSRAADSFQDLFLLHGLAIRAKGLFAATPFLWLSYNLDVVPRELDLCVDHGHSFLLLDGGCTSYDFTLIKGMVEVCRLIVLSTNLTLHDVHVVNNFLLGAHIFHFGDTESVILTLPGRCLEVLVLLLDFSVVLDVLICLFHNLLQYIIFIEEPIYFFQK